MTEFYKSDTYLIVEKMKATGNAPGLIERWKDAVAAWAMLNEGPDAQAVRAWLPLWQVRQFYTAAELAPILPMLAVTLGITQRPGRVKGANRLANELKLARLPWRRIGRAEFFAVEQTHLIEEMIPAMEEFYNAQHG